MNRFQRYPFLMFPVLAIFLLNSCATYHWTSMPADRAINSYTEEVYVHWGENEYLMIQPEVANEILTGTLILVQEAPATIPLEKSAPKNKPDDGSYPQDFYEELSEIPLSEQSSPITNKVHVFVSLELAPPENTGVDSGLVAIPLEYVNKVQVHELDGGMTIVKTLGALALTAGVAFLIVLATKDSCPFIYVKDGEEFLLVGEIYSGAIHPPLERHDYLPLPINGSGPQQIKIANEVLEIQHTNLAELYVFDHPIGDRVLVDRHGRAHQFSELKNARTAESLTGRKVMDQVKASDGYFFKDGTEEGTIPDDTMDGMVLTFDCPQNAEKMNLVVDARNSAWLDHVLGVLFEKMGDMFKPWQEAQKNGSPEGMRQWSQDQGLPLMVSIKENDVWRFVDYIDLAGPVAQREAIVAIDMEDIHGQEIQIKLECGYRFWEIDSVVADFTNHPPPQARIVTLSQALTESGLDVSAQLMGDDDQYFDQPVFAEAAILDFMLPVLAPGMGRSVSLHSKGHYEIMRSPEGTPDLAFVASFKLPGRVPKYSKELFQTLSSGAED